MQIVDDVKLDFSDVLIKPKRSSLSSRKDVDLIREFTFKHSPMKYRGIPIMAANMDTVATFDMAHALRRFDMCTAIHKHYQDHELIKFFDSIPTYATNPVFYSMGIRESDVEKLAVVSSKTDVDAIVIDVANGYSDQFAEFVSKIRDDYPDVTL